MIVNLNIQDKTIVVIGGGNEAQKRIKSLQKQNCLIFVISNKINAQIKRWVKTKKVHFKEQLVQNTKFISIYKPDIIITTINNQRLNQCIINSAKRRKIIVYSSDNPKCSDFSHPATIDFDNVIQIAIFTGGQSPIMSKKLKIESAKIFKKIITKEYIAHVKIQQAVRVLAKNVIPVQSKRRQYLHSVTNDKSIDQLIKNNQVKKAEKRAIAMLEKWK